MGAQRFDSFVEICEVSDAFRWAREEAVREYGDGGYSGTIAEKTSFHVITEQVMTYREAMKLATDLLDSADPRVDGTWGPAGAVGVKRTHRTLIVPDLPEAGHGQLTSAQQRRVTAIAAERDLLGDDETVVRGMWHPAAADRSWVADLIVRRSPAAIAAQHQPDGWLFFGQASF